MEMRQRQEQQWRQEMRTHIKRTATLLDRIVRIEGVELLMIMLNLWWGTIIHLLLDAPTVHDMREALDNQAPATLWSAAWLGNAWLLIYGLRTQRRSIRKWAMLWCAVLWALFGTALVTWVFIGGRITTWLGPSLMCALVSGWTFWRLAFSVTIPVITLEDEEVRRRSDGLA